MKALVRPARIAFVAVAWLFVACVVIQIYLAGLGVFDRPAQFLTHRDFGYLFGVLTLVMLGLSAVGRMPRTLIGGSALLLLLFALQSVFIVFRASAPGVAALHPLNGFVIMLVALAVAWSAWGYVRSPAAEAG